MRRFFISLFNDYIIIFCKEKVAKCLIDRHNIMLLHWQIIIRIWIHQKYAKISFHNYFYKLNENLYSLIYLESSSENITFLDMILWHCGRVIIIKSKNTSELKFGVTPSPEVRQQQCLVDGRWRDEDVLLQANIFSVLPNNTKSLKYVKKC